MAEPTYDETLILSYVEGDLSDADRARFEQQCQADPALQALADDLAHDRAALRAVPEVELPRNFVQDVIYQQERSQLLGQPDAMPAFENDTSRKGRTFRLTRVLVSSAIAALVLICSGVLLITLTDPGLLDMTQQLRSPSPGLALRDPGKLEESIALGPADHPAESRSNLDEALSQARADLTPETPPEVPPETSPQALPQVASKATLVAKSQEATPSPNIANAIQAPASPAPKALGLQVNVETDSPQATTRDLYAWADHNQAQVVAERQAKQQTPLLAGAMMEQDVAQALEDEEKADASLPADEQLVLWVQDSQLPGLMTHLNQRTGQRAELEGAIPTAGSGAGQALDEPGKDKRLVATYAMRSRDAAWDDRESSQVFSWGQVLESQLPLAQPMPLAHLPRRVPVMLRVQYRVPATQPSP